jgi:hypothetical protein
MHLYHDVPQVQQQWSHWSWTRISQTGIKLNLFSL